MYIGVSTLNKVKSGEPLVMKADKVFGEVALYTVGGRFVGYVAHEQPEGCVSAFDVKRRIGENRIICKSAVCFDGMLIVSTDSRVLDGVRYERCEVEGNGILCPTACRVQ